MYLKGLKNIWRKVMYESGQPYAHNDYKYNNKCGSKKLAYVSNVPLDILYLHDAIFLYNEKVINSPIKESYEDYVYNDYLSLESYELEEEEFINSTPTNSRVEQYLKENNE